MFTHEIITKIKRMNIFTPSFVIAPPQPSSIHSQVTMDPLSVTVDQFAFSRTLNLQNYLVYTLTLTSFIQHNYFEIHSWFLCVYPQFLFFSFHFLFVLNHMSSFSSTIRWPCLVNLLRSIGQLCVSLFLNFLFFFIDLFIYLDACITLYCYL